MFTRFSVLFIFLLGFASLGGCASFLDFEADYSEEDLDRGYVAERSPDSEQGFGGRMLASNSAEDDERDSVKKAPFRRAIETRDVVLGMSRDDVIRSWGEPSVREVAGNGGLGHERWTYRARYSLQREDRVVIFENGKVAGWYR